MKPLLECINSILYEETLLRYLGLDVFDRFRDNSIVWNTVGEDITKNLHDITVHDQKELAYQLTHYLNNLEEKLNNNIENNDTVDDILSRLDKLEELSKHSPKAVEVINHTKEIIIQSKSLSKDQIDSVLDIITKSKSINDIQHINNELSKRIDNVDIILSKINPNELNNKINDLKNSNNNIISDNIDIHNRVDLLSYISLVPLIIMFITLGYLTISDKLKLYFISNRENNLINRLQLNNDIKTLLSKKSNKLLAVKTLSTVNQTYEIMNIEMMFHVSIIKLIMIKFIIMNNLKINSIDEFKNYNGVDKTYSDILELYNKFRDIYFKVSKGDDLNKHFVKIKE